MGWIIVFFLGGGDHMVFMGNRGGGGEFSQRQKSIKGD